MSADKNRNAVYTDEFLERKGAKKFSTVVMTPTGFLTRPAWAEIVPRYCKGIWHIVVEALAKLGVDEATTRKLLIGQFFDGFKIHEDDELLVVFAGAGFLCALENRDSSEMNQAFDRWVALAGKKRARDLIDLLRRSNIVPIIDQWFLVNVGLAMLRDCDKSNVWEASFLAVNMHPNHRVGIEDWLDKIRGFTKAGEKFDDEVVDLSSMLPKVWLETPLQQRQTWLKMIKDHEENFDVDLLGALCKDGMTLQVCANVFRIYHAEKKIAAGNALSVFKSKSLKTPVEPVKSSSGSHGKMIYHLYKLPESMGLKMTPTQKLEHAITVRNRSLGPKKGTTISAYLNVEVTSTNNEMLRLNPEDVNMYHVLQQSACKSDMRRKVAKRTLTALGSASGMCRLLNGPGQLSQLKANLQFAQSVEEV